MVNLGIVYHGILAASTSVLCVYHALFAYTLYTGISKSQDKHGQVSPPLISQQQQSESLPLQSVATGKQEEQDSIDFPSPGQETDDEDAHTNEDVNHR